MTQRELIVALLKESGFDPDMQIENRTAFDILEAAVWGALDEIEGI